MCNFLRFSGVHKYLFLLIFERVSKIDCMGFTTGNDKGCRRGLPIFIEHMQNVCKICIPPFNEGSVHINQAKLKQQQQ